MFFFLLQLHNSESPAPGNDPGLVNGHDSEQWNNQNNGTSNTETTASNVQRSMASATSVSGQDNTVSSKDLFDVVVKTQLEENAKEKVKPTSSDLQEIQNSIRHTLSDSYPMQESMCAESTSEKAFQSLTALGFQNVLHRDVELEPVLTEPHNTEHSNIVETGTEVGYVISQLQI